MTRFEALKGVDITDYDIDLYDGDRPDLSFRRLKELLECSCDVDNLCDYAMKLAGWAEKAQGFEVHTDALLTERSLSAQEVEKLLAGNGVVAASSGFTTACSRTQTWASRTHRHVRPARPRPWSYSSLVRQAFDDDFLRASGGPIQC